MAQKSIAPCIKLLFVAIAIAPISSANATGSELHYFAPHQSGVKINKPVVSPVEEKIDAIANLIRSLRTAKTNRERNQLLNDQQRALDELATLLKGDKSGNENRDRRIGDLEQRLDRLQKMVEQLRRP